MITAVIALHCEARPFIDELGLKRARTDAPFDIFEQEDFRLIVSGIGKLRSAIATTLLLSKLENRESVCCYNIGIAGVPQPEDIGKCYWIHRVTDSSQSRSHHPDNLVRHEFPERSLVTLERPSLTPHTASTDNALVDMEASGFFEAANQFLMSSQVACLKIASDTGKFAELTKESVTESIRVHLSSLLKVMRRHEAFLATRSAELTNEDLNLLEAITENFKFTSSQQRMLRDLAVGYRLKTQRDFSALEDYATRHSSTLNRENHSARKSAFEAIRGLLSAA